ncbi:MAG: glycosyltransferase [Candidatus Woesearchaeota archaeon]
MELSIVIPIYNEERNISILFKELKSILDQLKKSYEIIFVNDGSKDRSEKILNNIKDPKVRVIHFRKNFGQTSALEAGFKHSNGKIIISMDGDLQNDPKDIPRLITKLEEGYDVVSGWRYKRKDSFSKKFMSKGADNLRKLLFKDKIHDSGCTLKAYKKETLKDLKLYGEMHRFIPALLTMKGYKITEIKVRHRKRIYEKSKYGFKRTMKGFLDMLLIKFWMDFSTRPIHLLGGLGLISMFLGFLIAIYLVIIKIFLNQPIGDRPLLLFSVLFIILGALFLVFGVLADILIKIYYQNENYYSIKNERKN